MTPTPNEPPPLKGETASVHREPLPCSDGWDCDSRDKAALLEIASMECEAELHLSGMHHDQQDAQLHCRVPIGRHIKKSVIINEGDLSMEELRGVGDNLV